MDYRGLRGDRCDKNCKQKKNLTSVYLIWAYKQCNDEFVKRLVRLFKNTSDNSNVPETVLPEKRNFEKLYRQW